MNYIEFLKTYQKKEVLELPNLIKDRPMVSVIVMAFNHGPFIERCLNEILKQQTNFAFEIILGEDESSDETLDLCKKIASENPDKIRLFLHSRENNILINGKRTGRFNFIYSLYLSRGKYIAMCDGDDFWTDPLKLQKQVDFLDTHKDYSGSFHNCNIVYLEKKLREKTFPDLTNHTIMFNDVLKDWLIPTASFVFRKDVLKNLSHTYVKLQSVDRLIHLLVANEGLIKFEHNIWSVYRIHDKSITETNQNFHNMNGQKNYLKLLISILPNLKAENKLLTRKHISILSRFIHNNSNFPEKLKYKLISIKHNSDLNWKGKILALIHKP